MNTDQNHKGLDIADRRNPARKQRRDRAGDLREALAEQGVRYRGGRIEVAG